MSGSIVSLDAYRGRRGQAVEYVRACEKYLQEVDMAKFAAHVDGTTIDWNGARLSYRDRPLADLALADLDLLVPALDKAMKLIRAAAADLPPAS